MSRAIVIPTTGRPSLPRLLAALPGERVIVVDDRADGGDPLPVPLETRVLVGPRRGPAAARNTGWRAAAAEWIVFLDDDVEPGPGWQEALARDLRTDAGASQGRLEVPLPADRRPTDWERNVAGLQTARWVTADMAYRRAALVAVGGFDERFPRAYREDADLALRVQAAGFRLEQGRRRSVHPVGPAGPAISVVKQAGNADDVLMRAVHGRRWRERAGVPRGRRARHLAIAAAAAGTLAGAWRRRHGSRGAGPAAAACGAAWSAGTAELAWARIAPGPRSAREVARMLWTSALLPLAATGWWLRGLAGLPRALRAGRPARAAAVLLDRDGTLIEDVPYNGDPDRVTPLPGVDAALARLRCARIPTAVVTNQSGIARGLIDHADVRAVHRRMTDLLGPLGPLEYCPHGPADGCACRKPQPALVARAAARLGVPVGDCVLIGDIGSDVEAARAAGASAILVPTARTLAAEVAAAPETAGDLGEAVAMVLGGGRSA